MSSPNKRQKVEESGNSIRHHDERRTVIDYDEAKEKLFLLICRRLCDNRLEPHQIDWIMEILEVHPYLARENYRLYCDCMFLEGSLLHVLVIGKASLEVVKRVHLYHPEALSQELDHLKSNTRTLYGDRRPFSTLQDACVEGVDNDVIQFLIKACPQAVSWGGGKAVERNGYGQVLPIHAALFIDRTFRLGREKIMATADTLKMLLDIYPSSISVPTSYNYRVGPGRICLHMALESRFPLDVVTLLVDRTIAAKVESFSILRGRNDDNEVERDGNGNICQFVPANIRGLKKLMPSLRSFRVYIKRTTLSQSLRLLKSLASNTSINELVLGIEAGGRYPGTSLEQLSNAVLSILQHNSTLQDITFCGRNRRRSWEDMENDNDDDVASLSPDLQQEIMNCLQQAIVPNSLRRLSICNFLLPDSSSLSKLLDVCVPSVEELDIDKLKITGPWIPAEPSQEPFSASTNPSGQVGLRKLSIRVNASKECAEGILAQINTKYGSVLKSLTFHWMQHTQTVDATALVETLIAGNIIENLWITNVTLDMQKVAEVLRGNTSLSTLETTGRFDIDSANLLVDVLENGNVTLTEFSHSTRTEDADLEMTVKKAKRLLQLNMYGRQRAINPDNTLCDLLGLLHKVANASEKIRFNPHTNRRKSTKERPADRVFNSMVLTPLQKFNVHFGLLLDSVVVWSRALS